jgi:cell division protein FtsB
MAVVREIRRRARQIAPQVLAACLVAYFAYHAVQGDGGILAYLRIQKSLEHAEAVKAELTEQRARLERRVKLLRPDTLDPDLLEERARAVLNFAHARDVVVLTQDETQSTRRMVPRP